MKIDLNPNVAYVNLVQLQTNTGQIDGVPPNPRLIKNKEFEVTFRKSFGNTYVPRRGQDLR